MKTMLLVLSIALVLSVSTPLSWGNTIYDTGVYSVGSNYISGVAQVLGTNGGRGGADADLLHGGAAKRNPDERNVCGGGAFDLKDYKCGGCRNNPKDVLIGSFIGPTSISTNPQGVEMLSGAIGGTVISGRFVTGITTQYLRGGFMGGSTDVPTQGGLTSPEPSTLPLLATGLVAIAGPVRRKFTRRN